MTENEQKPNKPQMNKWQLATLVFDMGFIIALPLLAFGFLGKYLDTKLSTSPWLTIAGILLAIISTTIWLTKKLRDYIK